MENPALDPERPAPPLNEVVIRDLRPDLKSIWVKRFIVLDKGPPLVNKEGDRIFTVRVADNTGTCILNAFNERGEAMEPGDIFELKWGITQLYRKQLRMYTGKFGQVIRRGRFTMTFDDTVDVSQGEWAET